MLALLRAIHGEGAALLLVTTNPAVAHALGGRVITMADGRVVDGDPGAPRSRTPRPGGG